MLPNTPELTEQEKFALEEQKEHELKCIQRQYNILQNDRQLFTCGFKLKRINKLLDIYKKEHSNIEVDLEVANADFKRRESNKQSNHLSSLIEVYDEFGESIQREKQNIAEIQEQIRKVEKEVVRLRSIQITDRQHVERVWTAMSTVDQLMNKLDVQNKKFGTICAKNRDLKQQINGLLWERENFMKAWNEMIYKLTIGKKFMMDLIEQATYAYDQREQWYSKLQTLRMKAHSDFMVHTNQMRELKRKQDNNTKLESFYSTKGQKRLMNDMEEKERLRRMEKKRELKDRLAKYRQHMKEIFEFTKETKVEEIAWQWCKRESQNFGLFTYIINLHEELEGLSDQLLNLRSEIVGEEDLEHSRAERRQANIENLNRELEELTKETQRIETQLRDKEAYIKAMLSGIAALFKMCKCNKDPILRLLGRNTEINVFNAPLYIEMIEAVIHNALIVVFHQEKLDYDKRKISGAERYIWDEATPGQIPAWEKSHLSSPCPLCVGHEMITDIIDSVQHAMTKQEVKDALAQRLQSSEYVEHIHNVSACFLPESRDVMQKRYI